MKKFWTIVFLFTVIGMQAQQPFRVMFYNVENLFDTKDDTQKNDEDFTPNGTLHWTESKYWDKLRNIARVITAVGEMQSPALVGMCEVENDSVLFDLTHRSPLRAQRYDFVMTNSPDERGIDVALLYQRDQFRLLEKHEYGISFRQPTKTTRNLLHVVGKTIGADTLDVFVCHFPSRSGGQMITEPARIDAAQLLRHKVDSLFEQRNKAHILIMGDFNDHPFDVSLSQTLDAQKVGTSTTPNALFNLIYHREKESDVGSYKFQGNWEVLDQIIVSPSLLDKMTDKNMQIFKPDFLLEEDTNGGYKPFRTYAGKRYLGGFSDHLPVFVDFLFQ